MSYCLKEVVWVGSSLRDLKDFPPEVKDEIGFALHQVQEGKKPNKAKPFKGLEVNVMEIVCDFDTNAYRTLYVVKFDDTIYVLHCFQKKSKTGIKTPQKDIALIRQRLQMAKMIAHKKRG